MWRHLLPLSLAEWRHHPWRHGAALLAVALGVALASSVQMINASALGEFAQAVRAVNGQPDLVLAADQRAGFDDALYAQVALDPAVQLASPVLTLDTSAIAPAPPATPSSSGPAAPGERVAIQLIGLDPLKVLRIAPALMPRPEGAADAAGARLLDPDAAYLNASALQRLGLRPGDTLRLASAQGMQSLRVAGRVAAGGGPLVVLDIAAAQARFGRAGRLSRIDVQLVAGLAPATWLATQALPPGVHAGAPDEAVARVSNLSRAYRVNLSVLAGVALLVGGFLVYSVVSLSVAQRTPQLALLGVLGLAAVDRRRLVLAESAVLGAVGSALGLAAGAGLAALALRLLGGDLGGGYFAGVAPALQWPQGALAACFVLGTAAAVLGAWWPARQAQALSPAQALKGLGTAAPPRAPLWPGLALLLAGAGLALLPPVAGLPLAAYAAVAALLAGGVALVPAVVALLLARQPTPDSPTALLALRRARFARQTASATVAGVVASLALSVAITVMVTSFREAVADWLDSVLPADVYLRSAASSAGAEASVLPAGLAEAAAALPGVQRVAASRLVALSFDPRQPAVTLVARALGQGSGRGSGQASGQDASADAVGGADPARALPLLGTALPAVPGEVAVFVSEPAAALYGWQPGSRLSLPLASGALPVRVRGVWRDYARQFGAIAIDLADYRRATGDPQLNDLALWLTPGTAAAPVVQALRQRAGPDTPLDSATTAELRRLSLQIFDRSFAVTVYLQAVAIAVGLVGVAASLSAQVLARRKEFGLLAHLGFTRAQVMRLVALETATWLAAGAVVGLTLGLAMAVVLVKVVNPQSFHWTMPLQLPLPRLAALAAAVLVAGTVTALWAARRAAGAQAVLAVKEDW